MNVRVHELSQIVVHQDKYNQDHHQVSEPWDLYLYHAPCQLAGWNKLIITPRLPDPVRAGENRRRLPRRYLPPQTFLRSWGFAVTLNTMVCKSVFRLCYRIPVLLEDFYTQVAFGLPWIMLKCISEPFNKIEFLGARTRPSIFVWKHSFYFIRCIFLKDWRRGRLYPAICHIRPKKWHMKDIVDLKCIWQLHAVCYNPYHLNYPKWANPPWQKLLSS